MVNNWKEKITILERALKVQEMATMAEVRQEENMLNFLQGLKNQLKNTNKKLRFFRRENFCSRRSRILCSSQEIRHKRRGVSEDLGAIVNSQIEMIQKRRKNTQLRTSRIRKRFKSCSKIFGSKKKNSRGIIDFFNGKSENKNFHMKKNYLTAFEGKNFQRDFERKFYDKEIERAKKEKVFLTESVPLRLSVEKKKKSEDKLRSQSQHFLLTFQKPEKSVRSSCSKIINRFNSDREDVAKKLVPQLDIENLTKFSIGKNLKNSFEEPSSIEKNQDENFLIKKNIEFEESMEQPPNFGDYNLKRREKKNSSYASKP